MKIPEPILKKLNAYIDKLIDDKAKLKKLDYGEALVGDVTQEFLLEILVLLLKSLQQAACIKLDI